MFPNKYWEGYTGYRQKGCKFMKFAAIFVVKDGFINSEIQWQSFLINSDTVLNKLLKSLLKTYYLFMWKFVCFL
mgnify:CR=1 FL=1